MFDFLIDELDAAEADGALAVLLQIDSKASVLDDERYLELAERFRDTDLQTLGWVGPSGAVAFGGAAELLGVMDVIGVAAGSQIGDSGAERLPSSDFDAAFGSATERLQNATIGAREVIELGIAPDAGDRLNNPESDERAGTLDRVELGVARIRPERRRLPGPDAIRGRSGAARSSAVPATDPVGTTVPHRRQPRSRLSVLCRRSDAVGVRALHRRRRCRRSDRRRSVRSRQLWTRRVAGSSDRTDPPGGLDPGVCRRHPDQHPAVLHRRRHGLLHRWARCFSTTVCRCRGSRSGSASSGQRSTPIPVCRRWFVLVFRLRRSVEVG